MEVCTCECGNQTWIIHKEKMECAKCGKVYMVNPTWKPKVNA